MRPTSVRRRHLPAKITPSESEVDVPHDTHPDGLNRDGDRSDAPSVGWNAVFTGTGEIRMAG